MTEKEFREKMKSNGWDENAIQACVDAYNESSLSAIVIVDSDYYSYEAQLRRYGVKRLIGEDGF